MHLLCNKRVSGLAFICALAMCGSMAGSAFAAAQITPTTPVGWVTNTPGIVVSIVPNTNTDSNATPNYSTANQLFVDLAVTNSGDANQGPFTLSIKVDGTAVPGATFATAGLAVNGIFKVEDVNIGILAHGNHSIELYMGSTLLVIKQIYVSYPVPVISSGANVSGTAGSFFSYTITASGNPTSFSAAVLPAYLSLSGNVVSGTVPLNATGTTFTVTASNVDFSGSLPVTVVFAPAPPVITSPLQATATIGEPFTYDVTYTGSPSGIVTSPFPLAGLTGGSGQITGTPTQQGTFIVTINVSNAAGTDIEYLSLTINGPPIFTGSLSTAGTVGVPFVYQISTTGAPYFYAAGKEVESQLDLNAANFGLTLNQDTGAITGTPTKAGTFVFPLFATNSTGSGTATLIIGIRADPDKPAILSPLTIYGGFKLSFYYFIQSTPAPSDAKGPLVYSFSGPIPAGINPVGISACSPAGGANTTTLTGELTGLPQVVGVFGGPQPVGAVSMTVSYLDKNSVTQSVTQPLRFVLEGECPHITSSKVGIQAQLGQQFSYTATSTVSPNGLWKANLSPFPGITAAPPGISPAGILSGVPGGAARLSWYYFDCAISSGRSSQPDPWPYIPIGIRDPDVVAGPNNMPPGSTAPVVPMTTYNLTVGVATPNLPAGAGGSGNVGLLQSDGARLNPIPDGVGGYLPANPAGYSLSVLGPTMGMDAAGNISGTPTVAGVFFVMVHATGNTQGIVGQGYGCCTLRIEHMKKDQPIITSPNVAIGKLDGQFNYTFNVANAPAPVVGQVNVGYILGLDDPLPTGLTLGGGGIGADVTISGVVPSLINGSPNPQINPATGAVGPWPVRVHVRAGTGTAPGEGNSFVSPDTQTQYEFTLNLVFWDQSPTKPNLSTLGSITASELVPFKLQINTTQNADDIKAVTVSYDNTFFPVSVPAFGNNLTPKGLPFGLDLAITGASQAVISGIPALGTSAYWPIEVMRPKDNWVLIQMTRTVAGNPSLVGFGALKIVTNPAPPNLEPTIDTAAVYGFLNGGLNTPAGFPGIRNMGLSYAEVVAGKFDHVEFSNTGYKIVEGWRIFAPRVGGSISSLKGGLESTVKAGGAHPVSASGIAQLSATESPEDDGFWDKFNFAPHHANRALYYTATRLPGGQSVDFNTGLIDGELTTVEKRDVLIAAQSSTGADTRTVLLVSRPVEITSILNDSGIVGIPYSYTITATGNPNQFAAQGLPPGMSIDTKTGVISGVPLIPSDSVNPNVPITAFPVTISATNAWDTGTQTLCLKIAQVQGSPIITSPSVASGSDGLPFNYQITTDVLPSTIGSYSASPLPPGLVLDDTPSSPTYGLISGNPIGFGNFDVIVTATNVFGVGGQIVHLSIAAVPPKFSSPSTAIGIVGIPFTYNITTSSGSQAISFTVPLAGTGSLPPGLTQSGATISGTPTIRGVTPVTITASNPAGSVQFTLLITVYERPTITSSLVQNVVVGQPFNYTITASGSPEKLTFNANPLPPGISFDGMNTISGVPTQPGTFNVLMDATNITGSLYTLQSQVTLVINVQAMQITSQPPLITGVVGVPIVPYQVTATGNPTSFFAVGLPRALTINPTTGVISGLPLDAGSFSVVVSASNGVGFASQTITVAISSAPGVPAITSPLTASTTANIQVTFTYTITATNNPTSFDAVPVDPTLTLTQLGFFIDKTTGLISGTPALAGTFPIKLTASNAAGSGTAILILGVSAVPGAPAIISALNAEGLAGAQFNYFILASNSPSSYNATVNGNSLASIGLNVDQTTGLISGNPTPQGTYNIVISASNGTGTGSATLVLLVDPPAVPVITSSLSASGIVGQSFFYIIDATAFPSVYGASNLPVGLSIDTTVGVIQGVPLLSGIYSVPISAGNIYGVGTATLTITIGIAPGAPIINSPVNVSGSIGTPFTYTISASGNPTSFNAQGLPQGLAVNTATGVISGTPLSVGTYSFIVFASNALGLGSQQVTLVVGSPFPTIISSTNLTGNVGVPFTYTIQATGTQPIAFSIDTLPAGLSLSGSVISGIPTTQGVVNAILTATNAVSPTQTPFKFTIGPPVPPTITSILTISGEVGVPLNYTITATGSQPITFTVGTLPPGLSNPGGATIGGTPSQDGSFAVPITATFSMNGVTLTDTKTLLINIIPLVPGVDTDGDCFPDDLEIALGSNPLDPINTPFGLPSCTGQPFNLPKPKLAIKLNFAKPNSDTITVSGSLPVPPGFTAPGQRVIVYIGGVIRAVTLGAGGVYISADRLTGVTIKANGGSHISTNAKYTIKLKGSFAATLAHTGLTGDQNVTKQVRQVPVTIIVGSNIYSKIEDVVYTAKARLTGSAK